METSTSKNLFIVEGEIYENTIHYWCRCNGFIGNRLLDYFSKSSEYNVYGIGRADNKVVDNIIYCDYENCRFLSVREVITIIEKIMKYKANVVSINKTESQSVTISNEKLLNGIGVDNTFFTPFEDAIKEFIC
jgi:nucleoside-diphosphate-sugar epimerase